MFPTPSILTQIVASTRWAEVKPGGELQDSSTSCLFSIQALFPSPGAFTAGLEFSALRRADGLFAKISGGPPGSRVQFARFRTDQCCANGIEISNPSYFDCCSCGQTI